MSAPENEKIVIIVRESVLESWATDASTFALVVGLIGIGWLLGSNAMQWLGALFAFLTILARAMTERVYTIAEARAELDRIERERSA